jgi:[acyl-carrier-protein] S-malonyltransferase
VWPSLRSSSRATASACGGNLQVPCAQSQVGHPRDDDDYVQVQLRGECMQAAADAAESGMVSVIGLDSDTVRQLCDAANERAGASAVHIANFLCPGNYVVSGSKEGCAIVAEIAKPQFKARMTVPLAVAGAFHTEFMAPAVPKLKEALEATPFGEPRVPVVSNVDAKPHSDPAVIKSLLAQQVTSPVLWEKSLQVLLDKGLKSSYEIGPNKVIAGIMKRVDKTHKVTNITA